MAPKGIELASAYISLSVSTAGVEREIRQFARGIDDIEVDVDANTRGATANVKRWRTSEESDPLDIKVDVDTRAATKQVGGLRRSIEDLGRSDALRLNFSAAGIAALPAMASGLAEVAASIQQVAQAGLALPGIMAGASSSIGTLMLGVSGIGDAYDAMGKAADDATKSGSGLAAQQRAEMSASFGLRNAIVDQAEARKDVNRAIRDTQRDLQDLNLEMRGGVISEKRAILEAQKARDRLYSGDYSDYRDALLDIEEADLRVDETRTRRIRTAEELNDANSKGVASSDQVVAANERWIRSAQGVAQAQGVVAATAPGASAAQENAALAMSKLAPEAQDFVNAMMDVQGPFRTLRNTVQGNMFRGMDDNLRSLAGKSMPMLEQGLGGIGDAWNRTFDEIFRVAGEDDTQGILSRIFGNTEEAQNILTGAIDPLTEGVGVLTEAGTRSLPRLADAFVGASDRLAEFITQADESGKLDEWISEGITALGQLGEVALNVGKMFTGITNVADGAFLENLEHWTNTWQAWLNSAEGQNTLTDIFDEGKRVFGQWRPILEDIPGLFKGIYDGASVWISALTTVVAPVTEFLKDHPKLVETAAGAYLVFKSAQVVGSIGQVATSLTGMNTMLGTTLPASAATGAAKMASALNPVLALLTAIVAIDPTENLPGGDRSIPDNAREGNWGEVFFGDAWPWIKEHVPGFGGEDPGNSSPPGAPGVPAFGHRLQGPGVTQPYRGIAPFTTTPGTDPLNAITGYASRYTSDSELLANVPAGRYTQEARGDLTQGLADCSSAIEDLVNLMDGKSTEGASMWTGNAHEWLTARGFVPGTMPGAFNVGFNDGHMQATLPGGTPFNWGSDASAARGGVGGTGAFDPAFTSHYYRPVAAPSAPQGPVLGPPLNSAANTNPSLTNPTLQDLLNGVAGYDQGGPWPSGTLGINTTGKDEYVLSPQDLEFLKNQGIDPASLQSGLSIDPNTTAHGTGAGMAPGPKSVPGVPARTEGYIPAAAGNTAPVGQGGISNILDLGESFFHNLIDTGAQLGSMAVSAAAAAGSFGAGAAAGPAASAGIQMAAEAGKRGVSYLYDLGGIWAEAGVEQLFPFGAPRWLGSADPMAFMPQGIPGMGEKKAPGTMGAAAKSVQSWAQPGNPAMANGTAQQGAAAALAADPGTGVTTPPPAPPANAQPGFNPADPSTWLKFGGIFDNGGVLPPKSIGVNLSGRPEYIFNQNQWRAMQHQAEEWAKGDYSRGNAGSGATYNVYASDVDDAIRKLKWEERRKSRQHSGRP